MFSKKISEGDYFFRGAILFDVNLNDKNIEKDLVLTKSYIIKDFNCSKSQINGDIWFDHSSIGEHAIFENSYIKGNSSFFKANIEGNLSFDNSTIGKYGWFEGIHINGETSFNESQINASFSFKKAHLSDTISLYKVIVGGNCWFDKAILNGDIWLDMADFKGGLSFIKTKFKTFKSQEKASRLAKTVWEKFGDRTKADYHFYREMEAKRKQKPIYIRYPELIVQYPFGYGVYPSRLLFSFFGVLILFGLIYWVLSGSDSMDTLLEKLRFSFLTMLIPAYGVINAKTGVIGMFTIIEAFIGAFTWPAFIVTFARKYMR